MIILHSIHSAESQGFVEEDGEGHTVIDWYGDKNAYNQYLLSGLPQPSEFPFVVDQVSKRGFPNPESIRWVIDELAGKHLPMDEAIFAKVTRLEQAAISYIENRGYNQPTKDMMQIYLMTGNTTQQSMCGQVLQFCKDVMFENDGELKGYYVRKGEAESATTLTELEAISEDYSVFDSFDPGYSLEEIELAGT